MFVTKKEQPNRVGHHLKRTAQRKFDILKFGQLSAQLKKGGGRREKLVFSSLLCAASCSGCQRLAHSKRVSLSFSIAKMNFYGLVLGGDMSKI
jgi:hypothetical protein